MKHVGKMCQIEFFIVALFSNKYITRYSVDNILLYNLNMT